MEITNPKLTRNDVIRKALMYHDRGGYTAREVVLHLADEGVIVDRTEVQRWFEGVNITKAVRGRK